MQQFGTFSRPSRLKQHWQPKEQLINSQFSASNHFIPHIFRNCSQQHRQCTTLRSWKHSHFRSGLRFQIQPFKRSRNQPCLIALIRHTTDHFPPSFTGVRQVAHHRVDHAEPITILNRSCITWQLRQIDSPQSFRGIFTTNAWVWAKACDRRRKWWQHRRWGANVPYNIPTSHNRHFWRWRWRWTRWRPRDKQFNQRLWHRNKGALWPLQRWFIFHAVPFSTINPKHIKTNLLAQVPFGFRLHWQQTLPKLFFSFTQTSQPKELNRIHFNIPFLRGGIGRTQLQRLLNPSAKAKLRKLLIHSTKALRLLKPSIIARPISFSKSIPLTFRTPKRIHLVFKTPRHWSLYPLAMDSMFFITMMPHIFRDFIFPHIHIGDPRLRRVFTNNIPVQPTWLSRIIFRLPNPWTLWRMLGPTVSLSRGNMASMTLTITTLGGTRGIPISTIISLGIRIRFRHNNTFHFRIFSLYLEVLFTLSTFTSNWLKKITRRKRHWRTYGLQTSQQVTPRNTRHRPNAPRHSRHCICPTSSSHCRIIHQLLQLRICCFAS